MYNIYLLHKLMELIFLNDFFAFFSLFAFSYCLFFSLFCIRLHAFAQQRNGQQQNKQTASIVPRAEIHTDCLTVCRIFALAKKVNPNHVHSVRVNTVIFHHCVMVMLHSQHSKEDRAHTISSIASNCKYKHKIDSF